jgi:hypothetical protein
MLTREEIQHLKSAHWRINDTRDWDEGKIYIDWHYPEDAR